MDIEEVKKSILNDHVHCCDKCGGLVKPSIVFFGENLPMRFFQLQELDTEECDLLLCIGTSLEVYPFAGLADRVSDEIPRILINRHQAGSFGYRKNDIVLEGDLVETLKKLTELLHWKLQ